MRTLALSLLLCIVATAIAGAQPCPELCTVMPQDNMISPRIMGIPTEVPHLPVGMVEVCVRDSSNLPIPDCLVTVWVDPACDDILCFCGFPMSGRTDAQGCVMIQCRFGGCCWEDLPEAWITADEVLIRTGYWVVSPDFDGAVGDCRVMLPDFMTFSHGYQSHYGGCTDYTGDNRTDLSDFIIFGSAWGSFCTPR